jgi:hypothetical protein
VLLSIFERGADQRVLVSEQKREFLFFEKLQ